MNPNESCNSNRLASVWWLIAALAVSLTAALAGAVPSPGGQKNDKSTQKQAPTPEQQAAAAEAADYQALASDFDVDDQLQRVEAFAKKYPNSAQLIYVYFIGANAEQQKGDPRAAVDYAEKSLKLKPDYFPSLLLVAEMLPLPQTLHAQADASKALAEAEADANQALQILSTAPNDQIKKQPNETDEVFAKRKASYISDAHSALGMVHLQRALQGLQGADKDELAKAEQEYQTAVSNTDQPDPRAYYRLGDSFKLDGKIDEAIAAYSKCSELSQGTAMQPLADKQVQDLKARKAAQAPAKQ